MNMERSLYKKYLQDKLNIWGRELSVLEDDVERSDEDNKEEYESVMRDLMRNYEDIESRLDEIEEMSKETFAEEKVVMDQMVVDFEQLLKDARATIQDI